MPLREASRYSVTVFREAMKDFAATFEVYSPRWGHTDRYTVAISKKELKVTQGTFSATCQLASNGDPAWSGYNDTTGNPLMNIFSNDSVYAPDIVPSALEWAWQP